MLQQICCGGYDLGDAGFVVGAQQGGSVGDDQLLACIRRQSLRIEEDAACLIQRKVAAAIEDTAGADICAGSIRRGVHVGNEAQSRYHFLPPVRHADGHRHNRALHAGIGQPQGLQFLNQSFGKRISFSWCWGSLCYFRQIGYQRKHMEKSDR